MGVQPTGRTFEVQHIMYRVLDGKIAEHLGNRDDVGMRRQLGLLPPRPSLSDGMRRPLRPRKGFERNPDLSTVVGGQNGETPSLPIGPLPSNRTRNAASQVMQPRC